MVQRGVDEEAESSPSTFALLMHREHPLVIRRAAASWRAPPFLEVHSVLKFRLLSQSAESSRVVFAQRLPCLLPLLSLVLHPSRYQ